MSQSTRSDQSLSQGTAPDMTSEAALQQVTTERNSLRSQNDQLWKIIEKQRIIIQNLQKDIAKVTTERDLLRHLTAENESFRSNSLTSNSNVNNGGIQPANHVQVNGHQQQSRRNLERKAQETEETSLEQNATGVNGDKDIKLASMSQSTSSMSSAASSPTESRQPQPDQIAHQRDTQAPSASYPGAIPFSPSSANEGDSSSEESKTIDEGHPSTSQEGDVASQSNYDPEVQMATTVSRVQHQVNSTASPAIIVGRDPRQNPARPDFNISSFAAINQSPVSGGGGSPSNSRNVSANIALGLIASNMPHLPPRSPRRERKDPADGASSPAASDNEDESFQSPQGLRKKALPSAKHGVDQPSALFQGSSTHTGQEQDSPVMSATKVSMKQTHAYETGGTEYDAFQSMNSNGSPSYVGTATRKTISGQIPTIPIMQLSKGQGLQELNVSSPLTSVHAASTPVSPVAVIIDQDAEKFRQYMNKFSNSSRRNVSAPIQIINGQDHASALGQAVAMENIQNQIEIQNQLLGQVQEHAGKLALNPVNGSGQWNARDGTNATGLTTGYEAAEGYDHGSPAGVTEKSASQLSLPLETRNKKRESTLQFDDYPKIAARSTSHQRDDDDSFSGHGVGAPVPPRRFDSQLPMDPSQNRVASPTPSGNSSLTNSLASMQPPLSHSRSTPTVHQQAFSMFADLEFVSILVVGSSISTNDRGKEQLTFFISIGQEVQGDLEDVRHPHKEDDELWRVEKQYIDFVNLDSKLRVTQSRNIVNSLPKLPDKSLFSTHAPSKVDARKVALEQYLQQVTSLRIKDTRDLCEFLSTTVVEREKRREGSDSGWKEGYLTKRGKNFGGWKTRYFMLRGPVLEYFDSKDGHHLGSIALTNAQIGRQQSQDKPQDPTSDVAASDPNSYRHAFLILEPKKGQAVVDAKKNPNSVIRHVLCAETDQERDDWVDALLVFVGKELPEAQDANDRERSGRKIPEIQKLSATPIKELQSVKGNEKLLLNQEAYERQQRSIPPSQPGQQQQQSAYSQGRSGTMPQSPTTQGMNIEEGHSGERASAEGQYPNSRGNNTLQEQPPIPRNPSSQSLPQDETNYKLPPDSQSASPYMSAADAAEKKQKSRMTFWPKKNAKEEAPVPMPSNAGQSGTAQPPGSNPSQPSQDSSRLRNFLGKGNSSNNNSNNNLNSGSGLPLPGSGSYPSLAPIRQVFGVTLEEAIEQARVQPGYELPAVVYRCIEYLNAHKAKHEEGIYRLNGSAAVIKGLKERFNHDGDIALLAEDDYYDIHAVAGLLKLFLRDLPSSILTRDLHKDFLQVVELQSRGERVDELTRLVEILPEANYILLRALTAHLIEIVDNADVNKMTVRNVGIVFSPTLGIPAGVFALLMSDFDQIFHTSDGRIMPLENSDQQETIVAAPLAPQPGTVADPGMDGGP
ncbi:hypothetical protein BG011_003897 [Mortierella polycephala]|uniref:RhoGAP-domain-containing protein n=1 Tax=Mortierella polycephala TaxID=41804 RepID=A0A9P6Q1Y1_9FUNG|nr:hypothetical protein BG011_003897 [Mortierella polycephala]